MLLYATLTIALLLVVAESVAAKINKKINNTKQQSDKWHTAYRWRWMIGIPFVIVSAVITYPQPGVEEANKVVGFPLIVAVFDETGRDYIGPLSSIFFLGNVIIWYFLPQPILSIWAKYFDKKAVNA
jgi:hypothetical protein